MDVHPKYIKFKKIGLTLRLINGARVFVEALINAQGFLLNAPLNALEAFAEREVEIIDRHLMLEDAQKEEKEEGDEDGDESNIIKLQIQPEEEPWQKKHREMYKDEEDEDESDN